MSQWGCWEENDCVQFRHNLYLYLDGELDEQTQVQICEHLKQCPKCRQQVEAETGLRQSLQRCCATPAPGELRQRILANIYVRRTQVTVVICSGNSITQIHSVQGSFTDLR